MEGSLTSSYIASGTVIKGKLTTTEDIRVDGKIVGNVNASAKLIIGEQGIIEGELNSDYTKVSGNLHLDKINAQTLILTSTAHLKGDIEVENLEVESGAILEGNIRMKKGGFDNLNTLNT